MNRILLKCAEKLPEYHDMTDIELEQEKIKLQEIIDRREKMKNKVTELRDYVFNFVKDNELTEREADKAIKSGLDAYRKYMSKRRRDRFSGSI